MSILAWFRGLFGKPTKKRQRVDTQRIYATYLQDPTAKVYVNGVKLESTMPKPGPLTEADVRFVLERFATSTPKQVARKLNKLGYLTPRGKTWNQGSVSYWRQTEQKLEKRREYCRQYIGNTTENANNRKQPQNVIFRNADLRPRQNGVN